MLRTANSYPQPIKHNNMNNTNEINDLKVIDPELSTGEEGSKPLIARDLKELPKKKAGRPRHQVLATTRNEVYELSKVGTRYEDIATVLGFSEDTLTKYYREELDKGRIESNAIIAGTLFEKAKQDQASGGDDSEASEDDDDQMPDPKQLNQNELIPDSDFVKTQLCADSIGSQERQD